VGAYNLRMTIFPHDLRAGTDVYSSDGEKLGELHRVVLARSDLRVTHVVVDIGFMRSGRPIWKGGLGLDYDRVVDIADVASATTERVDLGLTEAQFMDLREYTPETFEEPKDFSPDEYDVPDVVTQMNHLSAIFNSTPGLWLYENLQKSEGEVDIVEGTPVWRREPHEKLGDVKQLIIDESTGQVRALVIARGFIFKHEVVLPMRHVVEMYDDLLHVDIADKDLEQLQAYGG
jgi:uncharacterized protein YrrD